MDIWKCKECGNLDPCILFMPSDQKATTCPYSGTYCNWHKMIEDKDNE